LRDNGAIEGGAAGFEVGNEVYVLKKFDNSSVKVIGHTDGVHSCIRDMVIYKVTIGGYSVSLVWDARNNVIYKEPVLTSDEVYQSWYEKQKVLTSTNMFPSYTHCGRTLYDVNALPWDSITTADGITTCYVESTSLCTVLSPGLKDTHTYIYERWNYLWSSEEFVIPSLATATGLPVSAFYPCSIPSACNPGVNVNYHYLLFSDYREVGGSYAHQNDITFTFPYGDSRAYTYSSSWNGLDPLREVYASNVSTMMEGKYTDRIIANVSIAQHKVLQNTGDWSPYEIDHELTINAQIVYDNDNEVINVDWIAQGSNAALEAKIKEATDILFVLNGDKYAYCSISIEIL